MGKLKISAGTSDSFAPQSCVLDESDIGVPVIGAGLDSDKLDCRRKTSMPSDIYHRGLLEASRTRTLPPWLRARSGLRHGLQRDALRHRCPADVGVHHWRFHAGFQPDCRRPEHKRTLVQAVWRPHGRGPAAGALSGSSPQPPPRYPAGGDQPSTNAGSPTYTLDVVAALSPDQKYLTLGVINATESAQPLGLKCDRRPPCGNIDALANDG